MWYNNFLLGREVRYVKFFFRTQVLAILFALFWVIYINVLAFFDQPGRAMQYINWFVYGFGFLFAIIYFVITKIFIGRNWRAVPFILIPYFFIYQPIFHQLQSSLIHGSYGNIVRFLSVSTGTVNFIMALFGVVFGVIFSGRHKDSK